MAGRVPLVLAICLVLLTGCTAADAPPDDRRGVNVNVSYERDGDARVEFVLGLDAQLPDEDLVRLAAAVGATLSTGSPGRAST